MKNSTIKPPVTNLRQRKNPVNSSKANISFADLTDLFIHNCKRKNLALKLLRGILMLQNGIFVYLFGISSLPSLCFL